MLELRVKVTSKGQVTIPQRIGKEAGLLPGCEVDFHMAADGRIYLQRLEGKGRGEQLVEHLRRRGSVRMRTDDIPALTREKPRSFRFRTYFPTVHLICPTL